MQPHHGASSPIHHALGNGVLALTANSSASQIIQTSYADQIQDSSTLAAATLQLTSTPCTHNLPHRLQTRHADHPDQL